MTQAASTGTKKTRTRAFVRTYDYANGKGAIKDPNGATVMEFDLSQFPESVLRKCALSHVMGLIAGAGVEAVRDDEDATEAMQEVYKELEADSLEFRDGVGIAMGGMLKKVGRALVELGFTHAAAPDGTKLSWSPDKQGEGYHYVGAEGIPGAFEAMKVLWKMEPADKKAESGRSRFNKIKALPDVAAKLASYSKKGPGVELG